MAIQFVSSASSNTNTITMPTHQAGDMLIMFAYKFNPGPVTPSGWSDVAVTPETYAKVSYKIATSSSETSGTWTNATTLICMVYRGVYGIGRAGYIAGDTSTTMTFPGPMSLVNTDGTSWVAMFGAIENYSLTWPATTAGGRARRQLHAPGGTNREAAVYDTNGGVASWSADSISLGSVSQKYSFSVELLEHAPASTKPTIVATATAATSSIAIPSHQIGDLIILYVYRSGNATIPTKPASSSTIPAWGDVGTAANGADANSSRMAYFVATAANHTSGTWTNATQIIAVVVRGQHPKAPLGGNAESGSVGTTMIAPSVQMANSDGTSQLLHFFGARNITSWASPATGYTLQATTAASGASAGLVIKNTTTSDGAVNQGTQAVVTTGYRGSTLEILAPNTSTVLYNAAGVGLANSFASSGSFNHTASDGDTVIVDIYPDRGYVTGVTYGGINMKKLGQISYLGGSGNGMYTRYAIFNVPAGTASVAFTLSGSAWVTAGSTSYQNVQSIGMLRTTTETGTTMTQSATLTSGQMAVQSFGGASLTLTGHTGGTNRVRLGSGSFAIVEMNDSNVSDTFSSSLSASKPWGGMLSTLSPTVATGVYIDFIGPGLPTVLNSSGSFTHTASAGAYVVVDIMCDRPMTMSSVTYDGNAMTLLGTVSFSGIGGNATLFRYGIANVAAGTKTIAFNGGGISAWTAASSVSIKGVEAISTTTAMSANGSSPTQGVACQPGQLIIQGFGSTSVFNTVTGGLNLHDSMSSNAGVALNAADKSTTFNASSTGVNWGGLATVFGPAGAVFPPNPPYVIGAVAGTGPSVTLPTHQPGDLIVISAFNNGSTVLPTKPTPGGTVPDWIDIDANAGANTCAMRTTYFVATSNNHTSGSWSNSTSTGAIVYRGVGAIPIGGHAESGGTGTGSVAPSITLSNEDGSSAILHFHGNRVGNYNAAPVGYTRRAIDNGFMVINTKDDTSSDGSIAQTGTFSTGYRGATIEIIGFNGPVFDVVGAGASTSSNSMSWSHSGAVGAYVFAAIELSNVASTVTVTNCTYAGSAMRLLGSARMNNDNTSAGGIVYLYGRPGAIGQSQTISVTLSASAKATANSVSYIGGSLIGATQTAFGQGTTLSQTVPATFGQRIVQIFGNAPPGGSASVTLTPSGGFNRYNGTANSGQSNIVINDAINSTTFTATSANTANWSGIAAVMSIYDGRWFTFL